jgi:hypothetical protein
MPEEVTITPKEALNTVKEFTRESYLRTYGQQAPPFDPKKPVKTWRVIRTEPGDYTYGFWDTSDLNKEPVYVLKRIPGILAESVNIPGPYKYVKAQLAPSGAYTLQGPDQQRVAIPAENLSEFAQALALQQALEAAGWPVAGFTEGELGGVFKVQYDPGETRKLYNITMTDGSSHNVGELLDQRNNQGVGSPGSWSSPGTHSSPLWKSTLAEAQAVVPNPALGSVPVPQKKEIPGKWVKNIFSGWEVQSERSVAPVAGQPADLSQLTAVITEMAGILHVTSEKLTKLQEDINIMKTAMGIE